MLGALMQRDGSEQPFNENKGQNLLGLQKLFLAFNGKALELFRAEISYFWLQISY
jgi:hypothetical protein